MQKYVKFAEKNLKKLSKNISHTKVEYHCHYTGKYRGAAHSTCDLKFNAPNKIPVVFYKGSNYDYHFIINELANESVEPFQCLREYAEKYNIFYVPIQKEVTKIDKDANKNVLTIS